MCIHHWLIAFEVGKDSLGVCKKCGEERRFLNAIPEIVILGERRYGNGGSYNISKLRRSRRGSRAMRACVGTQVSVLWGAGSRVC